MINVEKAAAGLGLRSKLRRFPSGRIQGGAPLSRGQIHKILTNPVYRGLTRHKAQTWPGRHPAIIEDDLWDRVQDRLQTASRRQRGQGPRSEQASLAGKLRDETGDRLTPTHSLKAGRRHRYYVSNRLISGGPDPTGWRLPGPRLEALVADTIADHIQRAMKEHQLRSTPDLRADGTADRRASSLVEALRQPAPATLGRLLKSGTLAAQEMHLKLDGAALAEALDMPLADLAPELLSIASPVKLRRRGVEAKLVVGTPQPAPDLVLARALLEAHRWAGALRAGSPLGQVARDAGRNDVIIRSRGQLAFLAPKIQIAIRDGTLPPEITLKRILRRPIPLDWDAQTRMFGM